jgi:hypothetical protein
VRRWPKTLPVYFTPFRHALQAANNENGHDSGQANCFARRNENATRVEPVDWN